MAITRSESHQLNKKRKNRRMRRLLLLNVSLLLAICVLAGIYYIVNHDGSTRLEDSSGNRDLAQPDRTGNPSESGDASIDSGEQPGDNMSGNEGGPVIEEGSGSTVPEGAAPEDSEPGSSNGAVNDPIDPQDSSQSGSQGDPQTPPKVDESSGQSETDGEAVKPDDGKIDDGRRITLAFVGDILLAAAVDKLMQKNGYDYPYAKSLPFLTKPDLTAGNLENPITTRGIPAEDKQFVFKGSPKSLPALKEAGFDIVNLANNHTLDQGVEGLLDTLGHLEEAGMPNVGAGNDDIEAFKPVYLEANGISVAYVGLTRVLPVVSWKAGSNHPGLAESYDSTRGLKAIKEARKQADIVVVMVHWGIERADNPNADQKRLAHEYIDAGADLVIGSHPHVLQGFETYKGKWISYSLGNFIFNMTKTEKTKDTGVLNAVCSIKGDCSLKFNPMRAVASQPTPLEGEEAKALLKRLSGISLNASIDAEGVVSAK
ncbi:CapA family protein [Paenibacillus nasutitermitis]|uniref:Capsule synthesis protein CapA domain-containing protein n=1 Tax=Paenibacillus nasutitermitis TaxID=1652958 RepID=A0A916Z3G4_9BACL|nr:CapA family protein [Paenibacillus nasutitermitis]GGD73940.1 hypothetical protein GCM10010911_34800 [Paenibacillus nasutitermitis]